MMKIPYRLSIILALLMAGQSTLGLLFPEQYRDAAWIKATWFGNDLITLIVVVPLLVAALILARRGSRRGLLFWLGALGYALYNSAFYLFGAALNASFPLYVSGLVLGGITLILATYRMDPGLIAAGFRPQTPVRLIAGYLLFVGIGLSVVWIGMWGAYIFGGRPTPVETEAFQVVAAIDLSLIVPFLLGGGLLLWRRRDWGFVIAPLAAILGALYLLVLAFNSFVAIQLELAEAPGELPIWGALAIFTAAAALVLIANVRGELTAAGDTGEG